MTNEHTSLEKYTSHTLFVRVTKGLCVRGELETEQTATYWSPVPLSLAAPLSHSAGLLNRGSWGPITLCWMLVLSTASHLQLTESGCGPGLYNCLTSTCFLWTSHLHPIQPAHSQGYTLISRPDAPVPWSMAGSEVNMLHILCQEIRESYLLHVPQHLNYSQSDAVWRHIQDTSFCGEGLFLCKGCSQHIWIPDRTRKSESRQKWRNKGKDNKANNSDTKIGL